MKESREETLNTNPTRYKKQVPPTTPIFKNVLSIRNETTNVYPYVKTELFISTMQQIRDNRLLFKLEHVEAASVFTPKRNRGF